MSKAEIAELSMDELSAADTADMTVEVNGKTTSWVWTFAGPGHPKTIEQSNRLSRERLQRDRQIEQQQLNGKKVKLPDESVDEVRERNVMQIVERLVGWSPVKIDGQDYPFTPERAKALLIDPRRVGLLTQSLEFLSDLGSFTKRSA